ncbi:MAG: pyruvate dehydrogenase [Pseudobdellovibrionaceae bacterium]|nr:pyruvate dehydrogenase [Bdellovibrionales bacterium]USN49043.1 MAG: pyruvate dehydrogenase [Pseudobdellovibrionaceae bacterium]
MIVVANNRKDKQKGDPKVGGHSSGSTSALHILGALHLFVKTGFDHVAVKPHASPCDHSYNYLLDLFLKSDLSKLSLDEANTAMAGLRAFSQNGEYVLQSYHSAYDPDHHNYFPSGTVGIPPVNAGYLALAYRYAKNHGYEVPEAHFWAVIGDSEFREGSLFEAIPDFAERELGNLTWIIDYNRQSLDGHRITNKEIIGGTDDTRIKKTLEANGWEVIEVRHGKKRQELFKKKDGDKFKVWLEEDLADYELQAMLRVPNGKELREHIASGPIKSAKKIKSFLAEVSDDELYSALRDFGGHDMAALVEAMQKSKLNTKKPCLIIAHTLKGWGLEMAAASGNHSALPSLNEMRELQARQGLDENTPIARFEDSTDAGKFLKKRGEQLYSQIKEQHDIKARNHKHFVSTIEERGGIPDSLDINLKMASYPHTQWMLGQLVAKLTRIANTSLSDSDLEVGHKPLTPFEKSWSVAGDMLVPMAPDVGTSTNLNPAMDGKIYGAHVTEDVETELEVKDKKTPDLVPDEAAEDHYLRFEIAEANVMSCMGSFGRMKDILGLPYMPLMSVYDFFIKRAADQFFYNLYWKSSFILAGTPSGVTLSPEGAQHGWKSDFQIPNQSTWEPYFCQELDWIFCDALKRHFYGENEGRTGVVFRGVTRGVEQKDFLYYLKTQRRFKVGISEDQLLSHVEYPIAGASIESEVGTLPDEEILAQVRHEVLAGGYYLIDYRGYAGYEPGDNVVHIFSLGALTAEAIEASKELLARGVYANVIVVTNTDLLVGNLGYENQYSHLKQTLNVDATLYLQPQLNGNFNASEMVTLSGRRIPIVSVQDGEPGLLDNIGSIVGVKHESLAVRKHSRCGRPKDVYAYHGIDTNSIIEAAGKVLSETAMEGVRVSQRVTQEVQSQSVSGPINNWRELWPQKH